MMMTRDELVEDVAGWVEEMFALKRYGSFGIEVVMHDGRAVSVQKSEKINYRAGPDGLMETR